MSRQPTAAQRRVIADADADTGLLHGRQPTLEALAGLGLAVRHPRPPHRFYLTPEGRALRDRLIAPPAVPATPEPAAPGEVFMARTGGEADQPDERDRVREVLSAWEGLRELRRVSNGTIEVPCPWERAHLVPAVALALEAAGRRPALHDAEGRCARSGYRVTPAPQPDAVCVRWAAAPDEASSEARPQAAALEACRDVLERAGWHVTTHTARAGGGRFLLASPRRR